MKMNTKLRLNRLRTQKLKPLTRRSTGRRVTVAQGLAFVPSLGRILFRYSQGFV
jgi:hypothetical protein